MTAKEIDVDRAEQLKASGATYQFIAAEFKVHPETLKKRMRGETYTGRPQKASNMYNGYMKPQRPPKTVVFDLKVGDMITATEPEVSSIRREYEVIWIGAETYTCKRASGYPYKVTFRIKEYGLPCDSGHVKKVTGDKNVQS